MGFARALVETSTEQESKLFVGGASNSINSSPFMASSNKTNNHTTQIVLDQQQHQSPVPSQIHPSHHQHLHQDHHAHHHQHQHQHHQQNINQISFGMMQSSSSAIPGNFISKDTGAYDLGELDQALFLYLDGQEPSAIQEQRQNSGMRPPTLNIFPSQPMHVDPSSAKASTGLVSNSPSSSGSKRSSEPSMELSNPRNDVASAPEPAKAVKREGNRRGPTSSSEQEGPKTPDPKTLRRLAQNREAARKSRLRKKAYVQQLESSRIKLTQLEQEIQRARSQGIYFGGASALLGGDQSMPAPMGNISSVADATVFDMEYSRWLEEHHRLMCELRNAVQEHLPENELRLFVDNCLAHYDEVMNLKSMIAKSDVFHLVSGMWKTPAERCFMWMGGFRPSELIKIIMSQIEPLTEQQLLAICGLQQSTQEAEEALSQGLEALNQSLSDTIASDALSCPSNMANYMGQMALAMNKLSTLEGFVRQADNLRHQTIHRLHQILTTRQAARCFLAIAEYFHRLRALSSLWLARPRQE
ncbi:bZIP transcription factor TGA10 isoform X1 [Coffea eugenioides]|uniref:BZIP transcription factor TGA10-like isoform X1 n=2 Tax=Coffea arabica TaxID=13443 RepID=A0A6P6SWV3_COFAR|nr:bZIP transcription factor TGA10-like isoform X1 [Coffea arabica]XP_027176497.1 bZIP transcription factor TGA10 isoform X1 [Coffea eugenioides]